MDYMHSVHTCCMMLKSILYATCVYACIDMQAIIVYLYASLTYVNTVKLRCMTCANMPSDTASQPSMAPENIDSVWDELR